jgi:polar amino acid transport system permease protein
MEDLLNQLSRLVIWQYRAVFIKGFTISVQITLISMVLSLILALLVAFVRISKIKVSRTIGIIFTYVLPPLIGMRITPYWTAVMALVLQTSGYLAETFRGGIESVDRGQILAGNALGMNNLQLMRRIVLPQAIRKSIPDVLNNFVVLFKTSTLVSIVAVPDLMYQASRLVSQLFKPIEIYSEVAIIYLVIVFVLASFVYRVQKRFQQRERAETV